MACLELHTYSSLNAEFLKEYKGALNAADVAVVFYSPHAVEIKKLETVTEEQIATAFERDDLIIYTNPEDFKNYLFDFVISTISDSEKILSSDRSINKFSLKGRSIVK